MLETVLLFLRHHQSGASGDLAPSQPLVHEVGIFERVGFAHQRPDVAACHEFERVDDLLPGGVAAAHDLLLLAEQLARGEGEPLNPVRSHGEEAAPFAEAAQTALDPIGGADEIDHDVGARASGQIPKRIAQVLLRGIHRIVRAHVAAFAQLVRRNVHGNDARARPAGHHHHVDSHAAAGTHHGHVLHRAHARVAEHLVRRGHGVADDAHFGRVGLVVQALGQGYEAPGGQLDVFGVAAVHLAADLAGEILAQCLAVHAAPAAAPAGKVVIRRHGVAFPQSLHAGAHLGDLAGNLMAYHHREIPAHAARPGVFYRKPRAAGQHARHGLAGSRYGDGPLLQGERRARLRQYHRFHHHLLPVVG